MNETAPRRVICSECGARAILRPDEQAACAVCGGRYREMGLLEGVVDRWFAPPAQVASELYPRHVKLIELMWTAEGRGRETYAALRLRRIGYWDFVRRANIVVVRGLSEGWIAAAIPTAPVPDDHAYALDFLDAERWADELASEFADELAPPGDTGDAS